MQQLYWQAFLVKVFTLAKKLAKRRGVSRKTSRCRLTTFSADNGCRNTSGPTHAIVYSSNGSRRKSLKMIRRQQKAETILLNGQVTCDICGVIVGSLDEFVTPDMASTLRRKSKWINTTNSAKCTMPIWCTVFLLTRQQSRGLWALWLGMLRKHGICTSMYKYADTSCWAWETAAVHYVGIHTKWEGTQLK